MIRLLNSLRLYAVAVVSTIWHAARIVGATTLKTRKAVKVIVDSAKPVAPKAKETTEE